MTAITAAEVRVLSDAASIDLSMYRPAHVAARVARALARVEVDSVRELGTVLGVDAMARAEFRRSVAISVTGFFRDAEQFEVLEPFLRPLVGVARPRVWSAGCSTGRELWTMAVLLDRFGIAGRSQLLGSDILEENIRQARAGLEEHEVAGFELPRDANVRFEVRDIVQEGPPGARWDVVVCRNMAIYLEPDARRRLHAMLAACLNDGGLLLLGRSERLGDASALGMETVGPHLYRRRATRS